MRHEHVYSQISCSVPMPWLKARYSTTCLDPLGNGSVTHVLWRRKPNFHMRPRSNAQMLYIFCIPLAIQIGFLAHQVPLGRQIRECKVRPNLFASRDEEGASAVFPADAMNNSKIEPSMELINGMAVCENKVLSCQFWYSIFHIQVGMGWVKTKIWYQPRKHVLCGVSKIGHVLVGKSIPNFFDICRGRFWSVAIWNRRTKYQLNPSAMDMVCRDVLHFYKSAMSTTMLFQKFGFVPKWTYPMTSLGVKRTVKGGIDPSWPNTRDARGHSGFGTNPFPRNHMVEIINVIYIYIYYVYIYTYMVGGFKHCTFFNHVWDDWLEARRHCSCLAVTPHHKECWFIPISEQLDLPSFGLYSGYIMYRCLYAYLHTCIYVCVHVYIYIHIDKYTYIFIYAPT